MERLPKTGVSFLVLISHKILGRSYTSLAAIPQEHTTDLLSKPGESELSQSILGGVANLSLIPAFPVDSSHRGLLNSFPFEPKKLLCNLGYIK